MGTGNSVDSVKTTVAVPANYKKEATPLDTSSLYKFSPSGVFSDVKKVDDSGQDTDHTHFLYTDEKGEKHTLHLDISETNIAESYDYKDKKTQKYKTADRTTTTSGNTVDVVDESGKVIQQFHLNNNDEKKQLQEILKQARKEDPNFRLGVGEQKNVTKKANDSSHYTTAKFGRYSDHDRANAMTNAIINDTTLPASTSGQISPINKNKKIGMSGHILKD